MRILSLHIENYKILDDFKVDFDFKYSTAVIIGKNGSGKTTLIECLTEIFVSIVKAEGLAELKKTKVPFLFDMSYVLKKEKSIETSFWGEFFTNYIGVELSNKSGEMNLKLHVGNEVFDTEEKIEKYLQDNGEKLAGLFPDNLVLYYSGISDILYNNFKKFQKEIILGSLDGETKIDQPYFYFLPENFPIILIGLLSFEYGNVSENLQKRFGINGFKEIIIEIKKPFWAKPKSTPKTFWGARGDLKTFLDRLMITSEMRLEDDKVSFHLKNTEELQNIWEYYGSEKRLFEYLVSLQANGLISDVKILLNKNGIDVFHERLSEGEKQLLTIVGLKELLAADNSLFLLDEPDTYLHPAWKQEFISDFLTEDDYKNFFIITSHSPTIVSGLQREQLKILLLIDGKPTLREFAFNPYGMRVDKILIDFFGMEGLRFKKVEKEIERLKELVTLNEYNSPEYIDLMKRLEDSLEKGDSELLDIKIESAKRKAAHEKNK